MLGVDEEEEEADPMEMLGIRLGIMDDEEEAAIEAAMERDLEGAASDMRAEEEATAAAAVVAPPAPEDPLPTAAAEEEVEE